jgi:hypothetical protein
VLGHAIALHSPPFSNSPLFQAPIDTPPQIIKKSIEVPLAENWAGESMGNFVRQTITKTNVRELAAPIADIATFNTLVEKH